jgi:flagellar basal body-associated protein FliL
MTVAIIAIVAVVLVLVVGLLLFRLMGHTQSAVPSAADAQAAKHRQIVATDAQGRPVTDADEAEPAVRDEVAFESLLQDEIRDRGMQEPRPDDEA